MILSVLDFILSNWESLNEYDIDNNKIVWMINIFIYLLKSFIACFRKDINNLESVEYPGKVDITTSLSSRIT